MRARLFVLFFILIQNIMVSAAINDSTAALEHQSIYHQTFHLFQNNPAFMYDYYQRAYSELVTYAEKFATDKPILYQLGEGHTYWGAKVDTYVPLTKRTRIWGSASYRSGMSKGIKWNSTTDFTLLYPYVMGDTIGGDLNDERYTFSGGFGTRLNKFILGAELRFRAEHEYRTKDPRPRGIATDMTLRIGLSYDTHDYRFGIGLGNIFYKQTNSVEFYREEGVIPEYQMVGLGMDYKRFSGSNTSAYYKATGFSADVEGQPIGETGAYFTVQLDDAPYKRILPNLNSLPLTTLYLTHLKAQAGWKQEREEKCRWACFAGVDYERRIGDEHIAGNSSATEYNIITDLTMYRKHHADYYCGSALQWGKKIVWALKSKVGYLTDKSTYEFPVRKMSFDKIHADIDVQLMRTAGKHGSICCTVASTYYANVEKDINMPYATMDEANVRLMDYTYMHCTSDYLVLSGRLRYDYLPPKWKRYGFFAEMQGTYLSGSHNKGYLLYPSIGITF